MGFEVDVVRSEGKRGKRGKVTEDRVEAITELIMEGKCGVGDAVAEVVTKGIKKGAARRHLGGGVEGKMGIRSLRQRRTE